MTASFSTTALANERVLVNGTDSFGTTNKIVLDASEYNQINDNFKVDAATKAFNAEVEAFFAPLTEAADQLAEAQKRSKALDPAQYVVVQEHVCATEGQDAIIIKVSHDTSVLTLIEAGDFERLIWVGDSLEITEYEPVDGPQETDNLF